VAQIRHKSIAPLKKLKEREKKNQTMSLEIAAKLTSTPSWFYYSPILNNKNCPKE
jgi:hypothetical protein